MIQCDPTSPKHRTANATGSANCGADVCGAVRDVTRRVVRLSVCRVGKDVLPHGHRYVHILYCV